jgi:uncharacterized protein
MPNLLVNENSPYLLQHKDNPVEWYPWGAAALNRAREEDKPIFLSIGYAACHWCHVMEKESFEDHETAVLMNQHFINIKVDREERPDLDSLYMNAVVAMIGHGGWPMSIFLTPEGEPFYGGTYFPPVRRYNMPGFTEVLQSVAIAWRDQRSQVIESGQNIIRHLKQAIQLDSSATLNEESLDKAVQKLIKQYDWEFGGWGDAPKFPQPMALEVLINHVTKGKANVEIVSHALDKMAQGGMYDVVGGGFSRYSTDKLWLIPHFEKMLYDNALLARVYLHGYMITGNKFYRRICEETLNFLHREMTNEEVGGFYSSLDADSEGEEGKFYVWTSNEIENALLDPVDVAFFETAYGITETGNFEGRCVLQRVKTDSELGMLFKMQSNQVNEKLKSCHDKLLKFRNERNRPATDDKIICSWNALAILAYAESARFLGRMDYLDIARNNARFILQELHCDGHLFRTWRAGKSQHNAYLEDYGATIIALLSLYQADYDPQWYISATHFTETMVKHFYEPDEGFFDTRDDHEQLFMRPKDPQDNATPSGGALATTALLYMSALSGRNDWRGIAETTLLSMQKYIESYPTAFSFWLSALDFAVSPVQEIAIIGSLANPQTQALINEINTSYRPFIMVAASDYPPPVDSPPLLRNRPMVKNNPSAYVCKNFVCNSPVNEPSDLAKLLI